MIDYTLLCGVDAKHLKQLATTWPTWAKHKPSLLDHPMIVFYDRNQVNLADLHSAIDHPNLKTVPWPPKGVREYPRVDDTKFGDPQRYKMLSGFVHVSKCVETQYVLKLDTDTVATGYDDWVNPEWFADNPAIVAQKWHFTKPPYQMMLLDMWASKLPEFVGTGPLNLNAPGSDKLKHPRIISWCGFFRTDFAKFTSVVAEANCGKARLPVPSQDGYVWYMAERFQQQIIRLDFRAMGFEHWSTMDNIRQAAARAMADHHATDTQGV